VHEHRYAVYIMASHSGTLYIGVRNEIYVRVMQHKAGEGCAFTRKYECTRLFYYEIHRYIRSAIKREKYLKGLTRAKKVALIESVNPKWVDLAADWGKPIESLSSAPKGSFAGAQDDRISLRQLMPFSSASSKGPFAPANNASAQDDSSNLKGKKTAIRAFAKGAF
jgi:putative endonuclease